MTRTRTERLAPLTGIVFVVLIVVAAVLTGGSPDADESRQDVVSYWKDNDTKQAIGSALIGYASIFIVWFGAVLRTALRRAGDEATDRLAAISFAGAVFFGVGITTAAGITFAVAGTADDVSAGVTETLSALSNYYFIPIIPGAVLFLLPAGLAARRSAVLPSWLAWAGIVVGILIGTPVGFVVFPVAGLWILIVSVVLLRGGNTGGEPTAEPSLGGPR
jgi:hypothetical protein